MSTHNEDFWKRELVITKDGSSSIFLPNLNEHYHSHHGAVQESKHVFMKMGWDVVHEGKQHIDVLEIGFGTGLNAWLVLEEITKHSNGPSVHYTSLEAFPVATEDAAKLNYTGNAVFMKLHEAAWDVPVPLSEKFVLDKRKTTLQGFSADRNFDLVFFDAFAPRVQPEMWTKEIFEKIFSCMKQGGVLVTYCSKGDVRRNMIAAGFTVEKVPGPPGKREMLRAERN